MEPDGAISCPVSSFMFMLFVFFQPYLEKFVIQFGPLVRIYIYICICICITQFGAQHVPTNLLNLERLENECANLRGMIEIWLQVAHGK